VRGLHEANGVEFNLGVSEVDRTRGRVFSTTARRSARLVVVGIGSPARSRWRRMPDRRSIAKTSVETISRRSGPASTRRRRRTMADPNPTEIRVEHGWSRSVMGRSTQRHIAGGFRVPGDRHVAGASNTTSPSSSGGHAERWDEVQSKRRNCKRPHEFAIYRVGSAGGRLTSGATRNCGTEVDMEQDENPSPGRRE